MSRKDRDEAGRDIGLASSSSCHHLGPHLCSECERHFLCGSDSVQPTEKVSHTERPASYPKQATHSDMVRAQWLKGQPATGKMP